MRSVMLHNSFRRLTSINQRYNTKKAFMSTNDIRRRFVQYFEDYDHIHVPSSSVLPDDDPTLLFTNAGMNQFKSIFLGSKDNRWAYVQRAVNYQKCIRAGGKHNDLEDVGRDTHHQTFFEMLGNWSFNDSYSNEAACHLAWNFLVDVMKIDPNRLYVSYFGGNSSIGLPADTNCRDIWIKIGVSPSRILPFDRENFWEMGPTGPCGPCTEIHYDRIGNRDAAHLVNIDDSVVELWNIVFMSFSRQANGSVIQLPSKHIDTGMGLERLASVSQGVTSNFDTDAFTPIINRIQEFSTRGLYERRVGKDDVDQKDTAYRIVSDHLRAVVVAIADGAIPSGEGAGFVIRKMLRRACFQSRNNLGIDRGFCAELVPTVVQSLKSAYPSLSRSCEMIADAVRSEEEQYWRIIEKGKKIFNEMCVAIPSTSSVFSGENAWRLHDAHGFPIDITEDLAKSQGLSVDTERFNQLKEEARVSSKDASQNQKSSISVKLDDFPSHDDSYKYNYVRNETGEYEFPVISSGVLALFENGRKVDQLIGNGSIVLEKCQFYAEEGGQTFDMGHLIVDNKPIFNVTSVEKVNGVSVLHGCTVEGQSLSVSDNVIQGINQARRCAVMRAHTATHLLNWALLRVGAGRGQQGSAVNEDMLRFDYATGDTAGEEDTIEAVESLINDVIRRKEPVNIDNLPLDAAASIPQLQSQFRKDKIYPSIVRVCRVGPVLDDNAVAVECCSGTHVRNTADIMDVVIQRDRSTAKGVRRITVLTGHKAVECREYGKQIKEEIEKVIEKGQEKPKYESNRLSYLDLIEVKSLLKKLKPKKNRITA